MAIDESKLAKDLQGQLSEKFKLKNRLKTLINAIVEHDKEGISQAQTNAFNCYLKHSIELNNSSQSHAIGKETQNQGKQVSVYTFVLNKYSNE